MTTQHQQLKVGWVTTLTVGFALPTLRNYETIEQDQSRLGDNPTSDGRVCLAHPTIVLPDSSDNWAFLGERLRVDSGQRLRVTPRQERFHW